ncbi:hypothetical protein LTS18_007287 [Coniosporium uncinatum]|uniref:Uncharacterized protein n=1 Tax=Coniosporium uncinatum TaxID=93489 RepID=A0ACC3D2P9_9PEZI|nr:hypothetical protein LTS18_007287 [Coniosporium uncinatum]
MVAEGRNEIYELINRLFSASSFGIVEDDPTIDSEELERRKKDRRFKSDGHTNRQIKGNGKGVDRWPMFWFDISLRGTQHLRDPDSLLVDPNRAQAVIETSDAMITQWLSAHHFSPHSRRRRGTRPEPGKDPADPIVPQSFQEGRAPLHASTSVASTLHPPVKRICLESVKAPQAARPYTGIHSFNELSRIKSGRYEHYDTIWKAKQLAANLPSTPTSGRKMSPLVVPKARPSSMSSLLHSEAVLPSTLGQHASSRPSSTSAQQTPQQDPSESANVVQDETIEWTDPVSNDTYLVNGRTGAAIRQEEINVTFPSGRTNIVSLPKRVTLKSIKSPMMQDFGKGDAPEFLRNWANPVFQTAVDDIRKTTFDLPLENSPQKPGATKHSYSYVHSDEASIGITIQASNKLSREALRSAKIIAQVDKKFILVQMPVATRERTATTGREDQLGGLLVLIDQHAADERCKVEALLAKLCAPAREGTTDRTASLGRRPSIEFQNVKRLISFEVPNAEADLFRLYQKRFAKWAISYDIVPAATSGALAAAIHTSRIIRVRTLPAAIAERSQLEPNVLVSLLRTEIWKLSEKGIKPRTNHDHQLENSGASKSPEAADEQHSWLRDISTCPQGVLDMLNSRACRSAIMFNDELSLQECERLVQNLAECAFPFQCAHGRPSMVPLIELDNVVGFQQNKPTSSASDFVGAYRRWRKARS